MGVGPTIDTSPQAAGGCTGGIPNDDDDEDADNPEDDDFDDQDDQQDEADDAAQPVAENEQVVRAGHPASSEAHKSPEDEEFERELKKMMRESYESAKLEARTSNVPTMSVPMDLIGGGTEKSAAKATDSGFMSFRVLVRKGNKQVTRNIAVPLDSPIAVNRTLLREEQLRERQEIKRKTLEAYDEHPDEGEEAGIDEIFGVPVYHVQGRAGRPTNQKVRRQQFRAQAHARGRNSPPNQTQLQPPRGGGAARGMGAESNPNSQRGMDRRRR